MSNEHSVLSTLGPTLGQRQRAFGTALVMICGWLLALPFAGMTAAHFDAFVLIADTAFATLAFIAALLLYARFRSTRALSCLVLGSGFLFIALSTLPQLLRISRGELFDTRLYFVTSLALPITVLVYAGLLRRDSRSADAAANPAARAACAAFATLGLAALVSWITSAWPASMPEATAAGNSTWLMALPVTVSGAAIVSCWRARHSMFDLWLLVALTAWLLGVLLHGLAGEGTVGWLFAHLFDLLALAGPVLVLLSATSRESKLPDAARLRVMADDLNQPLFAITANADAAVRLLERDPPNLAEARAALSDIVNDAVRVSEIVQGAQRLLRASDDSAAVIDVVELVYDCVSHLRPELFARQVSCEVDAAPHLPGIRGVRRQLMQMLLHLISRALEDMPGRATRERRLMLRAIQPDERTVAILVVDSGAGLRRAGMDLDHCRRIADAHGGNILLAPGERGGTTLKVILPVSS